MAKHESNLKNLIKISEDFHKTVDALFGQGSDEEKYVKKDIELTENVQQSFEEFDKLPTGQWYQDGQLHEYQSRCAEGVAKLASNITQSIFDGTITGKLEKAKHATSLPELMEIHGVHDDFEVPRCIGKAPFIDDMEFTGFNPGEIAYIEPMFSSHYTGMKTSHFYDIYGKAGNYSTPIYAPRTLSAHIMLQHILQDEISIFNYDMEMDFRGRYRRITGYDYNENADWSYEALTLTKIPLHYVATYRNSRMLFLLTLGFTTALSDPMLKRVFWYSIEYNSIIPKMKSEVEKDMDSVRNALKPVKVVPQLVIWDSISAYQQPKPLRGCSYPKTNKKWGVQ